MEKPGWTFKCVTCSRRSSGQQWDTSVLGAPGAGAQVFDLHHPDLGLFGAGGDKAPIPFVALGHVLSQADLVDGAKGQVGLAACDDPVMPFHPHEISVAVQKALRGQDNLAGVIGDIGHGKGGLILTGNSLGEQARRQVLAVQRQPQVFRASGNADRAGIDLGDDIALKRSPGHFG